MATQDPNSQGSDPVSKQTSIPAGFRHPVAYVNPRKTTTPKCLSCQRRSAALDFKRVRCDGTEFRLGLCDNCLIDMVSVMRHMQTHNPSTVQREILNARINDLLEE